MPDVKVIGELKSSPVVARHPSNPILTDRNVPYPAALVFNVGVCKHQGKYVMVFRNDYADASDPRKLTGTNIGLAHSDNGIDWTVEPKPCFSWQDDEVSRAYDPRLTVIDGRVYMCFAIDTRHGVLGGIAVTDDFVTFDVLHTTLPDNRNMVLFPETIDGRFVRLERPFPVYGRGGGEAFDIWLSRSPDMRYWGDSRLLLGAESVPFSNSKIGPAAPPVKTKKGWLTLFHAVDKDPARGKNGWEDRWQKRYTAGIMLLDLDDPGKIVGMSKSPLLAPEADYETTGGYRNDVIFPGGMILEESGEVKIYYGAADTVTCLATASVDDLIKLCLNG
ncbi:MAG: glycoside hydrolase family 130 protein [Planctomycetota bacterium]